MQSWWADNKYGPGQPLDLSQHYVIISDNLGAGQSSKPSDGMGMHSPRCNHAEVVQAEGCHRQLLRQSPGLAMGDSAPFDGAGRHSHHHLPFSGGRSARHAGLPGDRALTPGPLRKRRVSDATKAIPADTHELLGVY